MTLSLIFLAAVAALILLYLRFLAVPSVWRWLHAAAPGDDPVWDRVKESAARVARAQRQPAPTLKVLPEFAPNALVLKYRGRVELGLTEGLVRALGNDELDAALSLCLYQSVQAGRSLQTLGGLILFPFAKRVSRGPLAFRVLLSPVLSACLKLFGRRAAWFAADSAAALAYGPWQVAATLQKIAVMGRKIPVRRWNLALDPLFVIAPLNLDEGPQWLVHAQPSVAERRERLLAAAPAK